MWLKLFSNYSAVTSPFTDLTKKGAPDPFLWTEPCEQAFIQEKAALCGRSRLHSPDISLPFVLQNDASYRGGRVPCTLYIS